MAGRHREPMRTAGSFRAELTGFFLWFCLFFMPLLTGVLATLPSATTTLAGIGEWSSPIFAELWPFGLMAMGVFLGFFIIRYVIGLFRHQ